MKILFILLGFPLRLVVFLVMMLVACISAGAYLCFNPRGEVEDFRKVTVDLGKWVIGLADYPYGDPDEGY